MMKIQNLIFLIVVFILTSGCNRNKLKTDEKSLVQTIRTEEEQLAYEQQLREEHEKLLADSLAKLPKGFRFKEDRGVDPDHPPVVIDFTQKIPVKKFNLSEIATEVKYIRLSIPDDSLYFSPHMGGNVGFTNDDIILYNNFGVHRFSKTGAYIEPIANSNIRSRELSGQKLFGYFNKESYRGIWGNHVSVAGNRVLYKFTDYPNEKVTLFSYELSTASPTLQFPKVEERTDDGSFTKGETIAMGKEGYRSGTPGLSSTQILGISSNFYAGVNSHLSASENGCMLATFNLQGDTLCKFTQFNKLERPVTSTLIRSVPSILNWEYKGMFSFKKSFNDTIFRLIPPNRMVPVYVFNLGSYKITDEDWYQTNLGLKNKIMIRSILETKKYVFLSYIYYNQNGEHENYKAIYSKKTKELTQLALTEETFTEKNQGAAPPNQANKPTLLLQNDIDRGLPFWPSFTTPQCDMGMLVYPGYFKSYLEKTEIDETNEKAVKLKQFVKTLNSDTNERLIMLVK
ncbi:DUF4933 domain-containing protein [Saccharicrinis sp. FJH54]|uniref:DUF4933 domain-containing protein n=1 Tax=Saccharicrinis sp. FJH54 TaxID=3344665 RepID=UPI0035D4B965